MPPFKQHHGTFYHSLGLALCILQLDLFAFHSALAFAMGRPSCMDAQHKIMVTGKLKSCKQASELNNHRARR
ncbi:hypothetical protein B0H11DRAFT_2221377 [Mycena galericulata]|nr:hypothetical protein B0H11DRAFT_2221377 [Mycena galericulata]